MHSIHPLRQKKNRCSLTLRQISATAIPTKGTTSTHHITTSILLYTASVAIKGIVATMHMNFFRYARWVKIRRCAAVGGLWKYSPSFSLFRDSDMDPRGRVVVVVAAAAVLGVWALDPPRDASPSELSDRIVDMLVAWVNANGGIVIATSDVYGYASSSSPRVQC